MAEYKQKTETEMYDKNNNINRKGRSMPPHSGNKSVQSDMSDMFAEIYQNLYNSPPSDGT